MSCQKKLLETNEIEKIQDISNTIQSLGMSIIKLKEVRSMSWYGKRDFHYSCRRLHKNLEEKEIFSFIEQLE